MSCEAAVNFASLTSDCQTRTARAGGVGRVGWQVLTLGGGVGRKGEQLFIPGEGVSEVLTLRSRGSSSGLVCRLSARDGWSRGCALHLC